MISGYSVEECIYSFPAWQVRIWKKNKVMRNLKPDIGGFDPRDLSIHVSSYEVMLSLKVMLGQLKNSITGDILTPQEPRAALARDTRGDPGRIVLASRFPAVGMVSISLQKSIEMQLRIKCGCK